MTNAPRPDFNYFLVNSSDLPGMTHAGFTALAHQVWNSSDLGALLQQHVVQGNASSVVVTGHSLGAGVATVLSVLVQLHLANETNVSAVASAAYPSLGAATNATNVTNATLAANATNATNATLPLAPNATNATSATNSTLAAVNATNATSFLINATNATGGTPGPANATGSTSPAAAGATNATNATSLPGGATNATSSNATNTTAANATSPFAAANATNATGANATARRVIVHALLFASPSTGDQVFIEQLSRRVNVRNVRLFYDAIPQLPCTPQIACNDPSEGAWPYVTTSGVVNLTAADMALQREVWAKLNTLELARFQAFNLAAHGCGYMCR